MADTQAAASEAGRALARRRWGTQVLERAVATVVARSAELGDEQRAELRQVTEAGQDREAGR
jgi:hypothetical protein